MGRVFWLIQSFHSLAPRPLYGRRFERFRWFRKIQPFQNLHAAASARHTIRKRLMCSGQFKPFQILHAAARRLAHDSIALRWLSFYSDIPKPTRCRCISLVRKPFVGCGLFKPPKACTPPPLFARFESFPLVLASSNFLMSNGVEGLCVGEVGGEGGLKEGVF